MSRSKHSAEERSRIAQECISGKVGQGEAARQVGVDESTIRDWVRQYKAEGATAFLLKEHNRHYSPELKEAAVKDYLSGRGSLREICRIYKIRNKDQLRSWIKVYNGHKDFKKQTGGSHMTKGRETTQAERIAVAKACIANGKNYGEVAIAYKVSYQQARSWMLKYIAGGESALEDRRGQRVAQQQPRTPEEEMKIRIAQLEHENYMLRMERDLLKKLDEIERRRG